MSHWISGRLPARAMAAFLFPALCLVVACGDQPDARPEPHKADVAQPGPQQERESRPVLPPVHVKDNEARQKHLTDVPPVGSAGETAHAPAAGEINWGKEATAAEVIAMARKGDIKEIEWHVMPNILRAVAGDGRSLYIRNESKGIDLRGTLIRAGVEVGKGGVDFRHVF